MLKTFLSRPRSRPRLLFQDQDQDLCFCPRGASRPRPWSRGLHHWNVFSVCIYLLNYFINCKFPAVKQSVFLLDQKFSIMWQGSKVLWNETRGRKFHGNFVPRNERSRVRNGTFVPENESYWGRKFLIPWHLRRPYHFCAKNEYIDCQYLAGGCGSRQRQVADGADVVFTDTPLNTSNVANWRRGETSIYPPFVTTSSAVCVVQCCVTPVNYLE